MLIVGSDPKQGLLFYPTITAISLAKKNHEITLLTWGEKEQSEGLFAMLASQNIQCIKVNFLRFHGLRLLIHSEKEAQQILKKFTPDIILTYGPNTTFQLRKINKNDSAKRVTIVAAMGHASKFKLHQKFGALLLNKFSDLVVAQCQLEYERLVRLGVNRNIIEIIPAPLDCENFIRSNHKFGINEKRSILNEYSLPANKRLVGCFANFNRVKSQDLLIRAFAQANSSQKKWHLILAGEGPLKNHLISLVKKIGIDQSVTFLPRLPTMAIPKLLKSMDAMAHPSAIETFGYSILEPLLFDLPLIAARAGIGLELEKTGFSTIIDPGDQQALANALQDLFDHYGKYKIKAIGSAEFVKKYFDIESIALKLINHFNNLIKKGKLWI